MGYKAHLFIISLVALMLLFLDEEVLSLRQWMYQNSEIRAHAKVSQDRMLNETDMRKTTLNGHIRNMSSYTGNIKSSPLSVRKNASMVVMLGGEMGNHLQIFANARVAQIVARQYYNISTDWIIHHQPHSKWKRAANNVRQCFPNLRNLEYEAANTPEFDVTLQQAQSDWLKKANISQLNVGNWFNEDMIKMSVSTWKTLLDFEPPTLANLTTSMPVSMPFLSVSGYVQTNLVDRYLDDLHGLFAFDYESCCKLKPDPDETVLHLCNFLKEMPRRGKGLGFEELSPNKTSYELLGHLKDGDKVAILTRFGADAIVDYTEALKARGLEVRVVTGQSDVQDFCFLLQTKKELVGVYQSTFARWAAYLGTNIRKARLYSINSPARRARYGNEGWYEVINWTHPILKERMSLERYQSEEQDMITTSQSSDFFDRICDECKRATVGYHFSCAERMMRWMATGISMQEAQNIVSGEYGECIVCHPSSCKIEHSPIR